MENLTYICKSLSDDEKDKIESSTTNIWKIMNTIWILGNHSLDPKKQKPVRFTDIVKYYETNFGNIGRHTEQCIHKYLRTMKVRELIKKTDKGTIKKIRKVKSMQTHSFKEEAEISGSFWLLTGRSLRRYEKYNLWASLSHIEKKLKDFGYLKESFQPTEEIKRARIAIDNETFKQDSVELTRKLIEHDIFSTVLARPLADYFKKYAGIIVKRRLDQKNVYTISQE